MGDTLLATLQAKAAEIADRKAALQPGAGRTNVAHYLLGFRDCITMIEKLLAPPTAMGLGSALLLPAADIGKLTPDAQSLTTEATTTVVEESSPSVGLVEEVDAVEMSPLDGSSETWQTITFLRVGVFPSHPHLAAKKFKGPIYFADDKEYEEHRYQYALSSVEPSRMKPAFILYPSGDDDVLEAIKYAREKNISIAVRTGGHQYSGASSTYGKNIQLDMSQAYLDFEWDPETGLVRTGISHTLREFNRKLGTLKLFIPHGQCSHVHLGGHVQTGGYGQLGRSFGLFADHVEKIRIITADESNPIMEISREETDETKKGLFWAVLGGSPGNFGVLTHIWLRPYEDAKHSQSRGLKAVYRYRKDRLKKLLDVMVETMVLKKDFPRNYDLCISVISAGEVVMPHIWPNFDRKMMLEHPELYGANEIPIHPLPVIVVYAQWADLGALDPQQEPFSPEWFHRIEEAAGPHWLPHEIDYAQPTPMSILTEAWVFGNVREFLLPYEKRAYMTDWSAQLVKNKWTEWVTERIDEIQHPHKFNGCKLTVQIQPFGGVNSQFRAKGDAGHTSFSWRDSTICCVLDCFYDSWSLSGEDPHHTALEWQKKNDQEGVKLNGSSKFCDKDRRVLWGSYGESSLFDVAHHYYEPGKYDLLLKVKDKWDPTKIFSPNAFCVGGPSQAAAVPTAPLVSSSAAAPQLLTAGLAPERQPASREPVDEARMVELLKKRRQEFLQSAERAGRT